MKSFLWISTLMIPISWNIYNTIQLKNNVRKKYISLGLCLGKKDFDKTNFQEIHNISIHDIEKCQKLYIDFIQSYLLYNKRK